MRCWELCGAGEYRSHRVISIMFIIFFLRLTLPVGLFYNPGMLWTLQKLAIGLVLFVKQSLSERIPTIIVSCTVSCNKKHNVWKCRLIFICLLRAVQWSLIPDNAFQFGEISSCILKLPVQKTADTFLDRSTVCDLYLTTQPVYLLIMNCMECTEIILIFWQLISHFLVITYYSDVTYGYHASLIVQYSTRYQVINMGLLCAKIMRRVVHDIVVWLSVYVNAQKIFLIYRVTCQERLFSY